MHLYLKNVSDEDVDVIRANECDAPDSLTARRFRKLWNEYERLRVKVKESRTYGVEFDTKRFPGFVHTVKVTMSEDVMTDTDSVNIDLANHPQYPALQRYVKANPR